MNDCCDWHAICLNDSELVMKNNKQENVYISYCPECNTIIEYINGTVQKAEGDDLEFYKKKYQDKILKAINHVKKH